MTENRPVMAIIPKLEINLASVINTIQQTYKGNEQLLTGQDIDKLAKPVVKETPRGYELQGSAIPFNYMPQDVFGNNYKARRTEAINNGHIVLTPVEMGNYANILNQQKEELLSRLGANTQSSTKNTYSSLAKSGVPKELKDLLDSNAAA